jgi:hypothetical protein
MRKSILKQKNHVSFSTFDRTMVYYINDPPREISHASASSIRGSVALGQTLYLNSPAHAFDEHDDEDEDDEYEEVLDDCPFMEGVGMPFTAVDQSVFRLVSTEDHGKNSSGRGRMVRALFVRDDSSAGTFKNSNGCGDETIALIRFGKRFRNIENLLDEITIVMDYDEPQRPVFNDVRYSVDSNDDIEGIKETEDKNIQMMGYGCDNGSYDDFSDYVESYYNIDCNYQCSEKEDVEVEGRLGMSLSRGSGDLMDDIFADKTEECAKNSGFENGIECPVDLTNLAEKSQPNGETSLTVVAATAIGGASGSIACKISRRPTWFQRLIRV